MNPFHDVVGKAISNAFNQLLSEKHLYQNVQPDLTVISQTAEEVRKTLRRPLSSSQSGTGAVYPPVEDVVLMGMKLAARTWVPLGAVFAPSPTVTMQGQQYVQFEVPSINTFCPHCQGAWPFNPMHDSVCLGEGQDQWFFLGYQCQQCKGVPTRFLVRREGTKIRLAGRDPIEVLPIPKQLPKTVSKFYSDAQIAHHAGQTLAGVFLLRTFIEQFWRTLEPVKQLIAKQPRATGDEQGDIYQKTLPEDFKARFPSLPDVYGKLSGGMHEAKADSQLFEESCAKILRHFEARKLYEL